MSARKPPARRQRRATKDSGVVSLASVRKPPEAPDGILKQTRDEWDDYWTSAVAMLVESKGDLAALTRLFLLRDKARRYERAAKGNELVAGSQGQPRVNPLTKELHSALYPAIAQLEDRFGLSPKARLQLGVTLGQAHASLEDLNNSFALPPEGDEPEDPRVKGTSS